METKRCSRWIAMLTLLIAGSLVGATRSPAAEGSLDFDVVRSTAALNAGCLDRAKGHATVRSQGEVEVMDLEVSGLPPRTEFDVFVIQVPNAPFGMSWYQGDIQTNAHGRGKVRFIGRFNVETFIVAPGTAPAPFVHDNAFPDAIENPQTLPIHTYHVGVWFNSPDDASAAGCPASVTPFNGEHNAGIQILSTRNFADDQGPLRQLNP